MIDAGLKALSTDMGNPEPVGLPVVRYRPGGDEHGILEWDGAPPAGLAVGYPRWPSSPATSTRP